MPPELICGFHPVEEILRRGQVKGKLLLSGDTQKTRRLVDLARKAGIPVERVSEAELVDRAPTTRHGGVLLLLESGSIPYHDFRRTISEITGASALVIILDGVTDPQNLGAILRSCDQFRVDIVIIPTRRSAWETATVFRSSAGASAHVPISVVPNLVRAIEWLKEHEFWIYGADLSGDAFGSDEFVGRVALVLGSEGAGLRSLVRKHCDKLVRIPSAGQVDSLNVSVAAGILMFEVRRQQGFPLRPSQQHHR